MVQHCFERNVPRGSHLCIRQGIPWGTRRGVPRGLLWGILWDIPQVVSQSIAHVYPEVFAEMFGDPFSELFLHLTPEVFLRVLHSLFTILPFSTHGFQDLLFINRFWQVMEPISQWKKPFANVILQTTKIFIKGQWTVMGVCLCGKC